jgi:hypothetical protein
MKRTVHLCALFAAVVLIGAATYAGQPLISAGSRTLMNAQPAALLAMPLAQNTAAHPNNAPRPNHHANAAAPPAHARHMPKTASTLPELGLIGLLSLLGAVGIRILSRKLS